MIIRLVLALIVFSAAARAQVPEGRNEIVTLEPRLGDVTANAPIPTWLHQRNEAGRDGAGLCVFCSLLVDGMYQRVPALLDGKDSPFWRAAKARDGGAYPAKLEAFLREFLPDERWVSWEGKTTDLIESYNRRGLPVGVTINTGELYDWRPIHHMVSLVHLDDDLACYVDNNDPGKYHWINRAEFDARFVDGDTGWFVVFLRRRGVLLLAMALWMLSASAVLLSHRNAPVLVQFDES